MKKAFNSVFKSGSSSSATLDPVNGPFLHPSGFFYPIFYLSSLISFTCFFFSHPRATDIPSFRSQREFLSLTFKFFAK